MKITISQENCSFKSLKELLLIIKNEATFLVQIFSLESFQLFQKALDNENVKYATQFTSLYKPIKNTIILLLKDSDMPQIHRGTSRILLYSNARVSSFIPYKFKLAAQEKEAILGDKHVYEANKNRALSSLINSRIDIHKYTAMSLEYAQCVIVFCMVRENNFRKLFEEVSAVDSALANRLVIKCGLNSLIKLGICKKTGNSYRLLVSKPTVQCICDRIGFEGVFQS